MLEKLPKGRDCKERERDALEFAQILERKQLFAFLKGTRLASPREGNGIFLLISWREGFLAKEVLQLAGLTVA